MTMKVASVTPRATYVAFDRIGGGKPHRGVRWALMADGVSGEEGIREGDVYPEAELAVRTAKRGGYPAEVHLDRQAVVVFPLRYSPRSFLLRDSFVNNKGDMSVVLPCMGCESKPSKARVRQYGWGFGLTDASSRG